MTAFDRAGQPPVAGERERDSMRVGCVGECMVELMEHPDGSLTRGFGGDTLNTALYLARLGVPVEYITALGDDPWSTAMIEAWAREGLGLRGVCRLPGRMPGLYIVRTDAAGERSFHYWRDCSAARDLFTAPEAAAARMTLADCDLVHLSGISLSLYGEAGRATLFEALDGLRRRGGRLTFDTNYRARGWPDPIPARAAFHRALEAADLIFASAEDLDGLYGPGGEGVLLRQRGRAEIVLRETRGGIAVARVFRGDGEAVVPAPPVDAIRDTTAAGDSFAAGYLAARLAGEAPETAARLAHRLAGTVIRHRGAVIPRAAMPILAFGASGR